MKKLALFALIAFFSVICSKGQINFQDPNYTIKFSQEKYKRTNEMVATADSQFVYTLNFSGISKFSRSDLNRIWRHEIEENTRYEKKLLKIEKTYVDEFGNVQLIYKAVDENNDELVLYRAQVNGPEEVEHYQEFCRIPLPHSKGSDVNFHFAENEIIILCITDGRDKKLGKFGAIWFDKNFKEKGRVEQSTLPIANYLESIAYNEEEQILYTTHHGTKSYINGIPLSVEWAAYSFSLNDKIANKTMLTFDDFKLYSANVKILPKNNRPFVIAMVGSKGTLNIDATGFFFLHKKDAAIIGQRFYKFSSEIVKKVEDAKHVITSFAEGSQTVNFQFVDCYFKKDGSFYTVFEDRRRKESDLVNRGQYIMLLNTELDLIWQDFSSVYGMGHAAIFLEDEKLEIFQFIETSFVSKKYPHPKITKPRLLDRSVVKTTISPEETKVEYVLEFNAKANKQARGVYPQIPKYSTDKRLFYLNGFYVTNNCKLVEIQIP